MHCNAWSESALEGKVVQCSSQDDLVENDGLELLPFGQMFHVLSAIALNRDCIRLLARSLVCLIILLPFLSLPSSQMTACMKITPQLHFFPVLSFLSTLSCNRCFLFFWLTMHIGAKLNINAYITSLGF